MCNWFVERKVVIYQLFLADFETVDFCIRSIIAVCHTANKQQNERGKEENKLMDWIQPVNFFAQSASTWSK